MTSLLYKTGLTPYPWWYVTDACVGGVVLLVGELPLDDVKLLSLLAKKLVYIEADESDYQSVEGDISCISWSEIGLYDFNFIVVNGFDRDDINYDRIVSAYYKVDYCALVCLNNNKFYYKYLKNIFKYKSAVTRINDVQGALKMPCIVYGGKPFESFVPGKYSNNKNRIFLKEKVKIFLFNSVFHRLIINGQLSVLKNTQDDPTFFDEIISHAKSLIEGSDNEISLSKVFYKYGKILVTLKSRDNGSYVVVVVFDDLARIQRNNEFNTIKYLKENPSLSKFVVDEYYVFQVNGVCCYLMNEFQGVTVDANASCLDEMTVNAFNEILYITKISLNQKKPLNCHLMDLAKTYIKSFESKFSYRIDIPKLHLDKLFESLDDMPVVFMHGDLKIENFIFGNNNEVESIIDWELSNINGFPLIDVLYLITYNKYIVVKQDFVSVFNDLFYDRVELKYKKLITDYMEEFEISNAQKNVLLAMFFLHHFSERVSVEDEFTSYLSDIEASLKIVASIFNGEYLCKT